MAWATQPTVRSVQPELAALMGAHPRDRLHLRVGAVDEPVHRAEIECHRAALGQVGTGTHGMPRTGIRVEYALCGW